MTVGEQPAIPVPDGPGPLVPGIGIRYALIAAVVVAIAMAALFSRAGGPFDKDPGAVGALIGVLALPVTALLILLTAGRSRRGAIGAALAYAGALFISFECYAMAVFPGGAPSTADPTRPPILDETQSLIGVTVATTAVMVCASLYAKGTHARAWINSFTALAIGTFVVMRTMVFR